MTLKTYIVLTALALSCFPQLITAQGNLVVNGGFDTNADGWTAVNISQGDIIRKKMIRLVVLGFIQIRHCLRR